MAFSFRVLGEDEIRIPNADPEGHSLKTDKIRIKIRNSLMHKIGFVKIQFSYVQTMPGFQQLGWRTFRDKDAPCGQLLPLVSAGHSLHVLPTRPFDSSGGWQQ